MMKQLPLSSVARVRYGKGLNASARNADGEVPVYGSAGIVGYHDQALVEGSSIIIGRKGNAGAVHLAMGPSWPIDTTYYLELTEEIDISYLAHQLSALHLGQLDSSTAVPSLRRGDLERQEIALFSQEHQLEIVSEIEKQFTRLKAAAAALEQARATLVAYRGRVVDQSLDGVENALPTGWAWATPREIANNEKYSLAIGPFGSNLKVSDYTSEGVPLVFVRHIRSEAFELDARFIALDKANALRAHQVHPGDVLVTKMGDPPGDACIYPLDRPTAVMTADCIKLTVNPDIAIAKFVAYVIRSRVVRRQVLDLTRGVAQKKISLGRFSGIRIPLPPLEVQAALVSFYERQMSLAEQVETEVDKAFRKSERLRESILTQAFSGRLVGLAS